MSTPEAGLRARILKTLRLDYPPSKGEVRVWGQPAGPATGAGHTDLFGVALGHPFGLEIKIAKGRLAPTQITRIYDLRQCGTYAFAVRSEAEASRAVYWAKHGRRTPMPDEPIDFDDWFRTVVNETPVTEVVQAVEQVFPPEGERYGEPALEGADTSPGVLQAQADVQRLNADLPAPDIADVIEGMSIQAEADLDQNLAYMIEVTKAVGDRVTEVWAVLGALVNAVELNSVALKLLVQEAVAQRHALVALLKEVGMEEQATTLEGIPEPEIPEMPGNGASVPSPGRPRRRRRAATES